MLLLLITYNFKLFRYIIVLRSLINRGLYLCIISVYVLYTIPCTGCLKNGGVPWKERLVGWFETTGCYRGSSAGKLALWLVEVFFANISLTKLRRTLSLRKKLCAESLLWRNSNIFVTPCIFILNIPHTYTTYICTYIQLQWSSQEQCSSLPNYTKKLRVTWLVKLNELLRYS